MNHDTLLAFNLFQAAQDQSVPLAVELHWHPAVARLVPGLQRCCAAWPERLQLRLMGPALPEELPAAPTGGVVLAYLHLSLDAAAEWQAQDPARRASNNLPPAGSFDEALWKEVCAHDYSLGGLNEWNGQPDTYAAPVLQHLSAAHSWRHFPMLLEPWMRERRRILGRRLRALDVGCGPISRLRWGALEDLLMVTGVDPLNDLYRALLGRHRLEGLPDLHPAERIGGFAETMEVPKGAFDFVYSCNALDHTQDLPMSFHRIADAMAPGAACAVQMYTREGTRQGFDGLHKYDCWVEGARLLFREQSGPVLELAQVEPRLRVARSLHADSHSFALELAAAA